MRQAARRTWLETYFDHDYIFIFDRKDERILWMVGNHADPKWFASARPGLTSVIEHARPYPTVRSDPSDQLGLPNGAAISERQSSAASWAAGRYAAAAVGQPDDFCVTDSVAPIIMSVKFIDDRALTIAGQRLANLRKSRKSER